MLIHYGLHEYLYTALDSILSQDWPNIQLILADDGTKGLDTERIRAYVEANRRENITDFQLLHPEQNRGTPANLLNGYAHCTGDYITQFASDDRLHGPEVLSCYAAALEKVPDDVCGVYGRTYRCDQQLEYRGAGETITPSFAMLLNGYTPERQYARLCSYCHFHLGSTAFRRERMNWYAGLDRDYSMMEDWPIFIRSTRAGWRYLFTGDPTLDYRADGVSGTMKMTEPKKKCFYDTKTLYELDILPHSRGLQADEFFWAAQMFEYQKISINKAFKNLPYPPKITYLADNPKGALEYYHHHLDRYGHWLRLLICWLAVQAVLLAALIAGLACCPGLWKLAAAAGAVLLSAGLYLRSGRIRSILKFFLSRHTCDMSESTEEDV